MTRRLQPLDIARLHDVGDPRVCPDGERVAVVHITVDLDADEYRSAIWLASVDGAAPPHRLTDGQHRDVRPRWAPDGRRLAFVSHRNPPGAELYVLPLDGGEPWCVADLPEEIEDLAWSPDGTRLAFTCRHRDEDRYGTERDRSRPPRRIDRLSYRLDSVGWTIDRPRHVWVAEALQPSSSAPPPARMVTSGPYQDSGVAWSPDGQWLVFSSARTDTWDTDLATDLYRVAADGGEPHRLTGGGTTHGQPSWSADGAHIAFVWGDRRSLVRHGQIGVVDADGGNERLLTAHLDRNCAPYLALARDPLWDGDRLLFQVDDAGNVPLLAVDLAGTTEEQVAGDRQVLGFDRAGGTTAVVLSDATTLPELHVVDPERNGGVRRITAFGADTQATFSFSAPQRFTATSADGTEVEAWAMAPVGADGEVDRSGPHPVLLNIHGGPFSQYGNKLFDEFQLLASAGFAVVYANPRGSSGYSESFARAIRGPGAEVDPGSGWGGVDYQDVLAVTEAAVRRFGWCDPERIGVMGGSYGGYLTSWIVGHTDRFRSACSERSLNNMLTFAHTSDIGAHFPAGYIGASHLDDPGEFVRQSPTTYADAITTPLLILHSEDDLRCPIEQAEDLFVRLKLRGRHVEFVRFPGESHELSRSGGPRHRVTRADLLIDWFRRTL